MLWTSIKRFFLLSPLKEKIGNSVMAGLPRILVSGEKTAYHVMSRTALPGYPLDDVEKDFFVALTKKLWLLYFVEILGCCCIWNHFHVLVRSRPIPISAMRR
jgi:hypothetical protein